MAEIDTRPLESVQSALTLFEPKTSDQSRCSSPNRNEQEIDVLTKELASCKLQLEVKENENKQANLRLEALQKAMQELSEKHDRACLDAGSRIAELEAGNGVIASRQSETAAECKALRDELAVARGELDTVKGANAYVLEEVELMETRRILERESTKEALTRILLLNEAVLSSAVAAVRAEEERSVFFQEITMGLFNSDRNLEAMRSQVGVMECMERELLAKTVEIEYLQSELKQLRELYASSSEQVLNATANTADHQVSETAVKDQEPEPEFTFQHSPETCFVAQISGGDDQVVTSVDTDMEGKMPGDVADDTEGAEVIVPNSTASRGDSEPANSRSGDKDMNSIKFENELENQEQGGELGDLVDSNACISPSPESADTYFDTELPDRENIQSDDGNIKCRMSENVLEGQEEPKAEFCFVAESSRDDFLSVHSDDEDMNTGMAENLPRNQEHQAEAEIVKQILCKGNSDAADTGFSTEIVTEISKDDGGGEIGEANKLDDGYVLVARKAEDRGALKDKLDAAHNEISDLRFSLEEAVRRAELAEEAKAALERELREEIQKKQRPRRRAPLEDIPPAREGTPTAAPARLRPTLSRTAPGTPRNAPRSHGSPSPRCLALGKVLNMKYK